MKLDKCIAKGECRTTFCWGVFQMIKIERLFLGAVFLFVASFGWMGSANAEIDCATNQIFAHTLICSDPGLLDAERRHEQLFEAVFDRIGDERLFDFYRIWSQERDACETFDCLNAIYISQIAWIVSIEQFDTLLALMPSQGHHAEIGLIGLGWSDSGGVRLDIVGIGRIHSVRISHNFFNNTIGYQGYAEIPKHIRDFRLGVSEKSGVYLRHLPTDKITALRSFDVDPLDVYFQIQDGCAGTNYEMKVCKSEINRLRRAVFDFYISEARSLGMNDLVDALLQYRSEVEAVLYQQYLRAEGSNATNAWLGLENGFYESQISVFEYLVYD